MVGFWKRVIMLLMVSSLILGVLGTPVLAANKDKGAFESKTENNNNLKDESFTKNQLTEIDALLKDGKFKKDIEVGIVLKEYVNISGNFIDFDEAAALNAGFDSVLVAELKEEYNKANEYLSSQQSAQSMNLAGTVQPAAKAKCSGAHKYVGNIIAGTVYINSCNTTKILAVIAIGGGVTALAALIPVPGAAVAGGAATAIIAIGGGVILYNSAGGNGIKVRLLQNPFTKKIYPYWIKSQ